MGSSSATGVESLRAGGHHSGEEGKFKASFVFPNDMFTSTSGNSQNVALFTHLSLLSMQNVADHLIFPKMKGFSAASIRWSGCLF